MAEDPDVTKKRLQKLVPAGNNIQVDSSPAGAGSAFDPGPGGPQPLAQAPAKFDPAAFAATGGKQAAEERTPPAAAAPEQGAGGHLMNSWNTFIDHPENRAGMMQFAVNMLSGKGFGESVGGAAEATGRNVAAQEEEQKFAEQQALKARETAAYETTARAHLIAAGKKTGADTYYEHLAAQEGKQGRQDLQKRFEAWVDDPVAGRGILSDVTAKFPNVKNKSDLQKEGNEAALAYARQRHAALLGGGGGGGPAPQEFKPPAGAVPMNVQGHKVWYDPKTKRPVPGQFGD